MSNTELIAGLCEIIERQNSIIKEQAMELGQYTALTQAEEIEATRRRYHEIMGQDQTEEVER